MAFRAFQTVCQTKANKAMHGNQVDGHYGHPNVGSNQANGPPFHPLQVSRHAYIGMSPQSCLPWQHAQPTWCPQGQVPPTKIGPLRASKSWLKLFICTYSPPSPIFKARLDAHVCSILAAPPGCCQGAAKACPHHQGHHQAHSQSKGPPNPSRGDVWGPPTRFGAMPMVAPWPTPLCLGGVHTAQGGWWCPWRRHSSLAKCMPHMLFKVCTWCTPKGGAF